MLRTTGPGANRPRPRLELRPDSIVGDKALGLLGPDVLRASATGEAPPWLRQAVQSGESAARDRLRASRLRSSREMAHLIAAVFGQAVWSGPLCSPRVAGAMWGKATLLRSLERYRIGDLVVMRDDRPLDLTPLGPATARLGRRASVLVEELQRPNTGLRLHGVQAYHPGVRAFADQLAKILGTKINVNGYASLSQGQIFPEHWDAHDVALLQTHGRKRWRLRPNHLPMPLAAHRQVLRPRRASKQTTVTLEPGRMLFMPRGHWHVGTGRESCHLTFGLPEDTVALRLAEASLRALAPCARELSCRASMFMFAPSSPAALTALQAAFETYVAELRAELFDPRQLRQRPAFFGRRFF